MHTFLGSFWRICSIKPKKQSKKEHHKEARQQEVRRGKEAGTTQAKGERRTATQQS